MNIQSITKILTDAGIELNEAKKETEMLLEHFCGYTFKDMLMGKELTLGQLALIEEKVCFRAETRTPIQYIIGKAWFMDNYFKVTQDVLIPRDETEILVREAIKVIKENNYKDVLDIGTGSGCIACTIAQRTNSTVLGVDISSDALRIALDNVTKLGINNHAVFRKSDLFEKIREDEKFDIIVSNPPYIPMGTELPSEVEHEPKTALFAEENGIAIYRRIIEEAPEYLKDGGSIMFELGIGESPAVKYYMDECFKDIYIIKDMAGIDRVICGTKK